MNRKIILAFIVFAIASGVALAMLGRAWVSIPGLPMFKPKYLNSALIAAARSYPQDDQLPVIEASAKPGSLGVSRNIVYMGEVVARADKERSIYCVGILFDAYMKAAEISAGGGNFRLPRVSTTNFRDFRSEWYGADGNEKTFVRALVDRHLGEEITDREEARAGDLVQLWRRKSGHAAIFLNWQRDDSGKIIGLDYWGTHGGKLGTATEFLARADDPEAQGIRKIYIVRAYTP